MLHLGEAAIGSRFLSGPVIVGSKVAAHPLGRGIRSYQVWPFVFEVPQLIHQVVILVITDYWGVFHIVPPAVLPENGPKLLNLLFSLFPVH